MYFVYLATVGIGNGIVETRRREERERGEINERSRGAHAWGRHDKIPEETRDRVFFPSHSVYVRRVDTIERYLSLPL